MKCPYDITNRNVRISGEDDINSFWISEVNQSDVMKAINKLFLVKLVAEELTSNAEKPVFAFVWLKNHLHLNVRLKGDPLKQ